MRVELITRAWAEQQQIKEVMLFLQSHNVSTGLAVKIYKQYGDDAVEIVKTDPYRLAREVYGIGFVTADKIARELGIAADAPERVAAGVAYVLGQAADDGQRLSARDELATRSAELLGVDSTLALDGHRRAARERAGVGGEMAATPGASQYLAEERPVYLIPFYYGEIGVTNRLRRLIDAPGDRLAAFQAFNWPAAFAALAHQPVSDTAAPRVALTPQQMQAVQAALTCRVTVLTGGPGTGKTTAPRSSSAWPRPRARGSCWPRPPVARPSASAKPPAVRRRPSTACWSSSRPKGFAFQRNEENPLDADLVIVDEASMLDLLLTNHLLKAIPPGAHLLLVGDVDQLPSVGAGNVLRDVIEAIEGRSDQPPAATCRPRPATAPSSGSIPSSARRRAATSSPTPTASTTARCRCWTTAERRPTSSCFARKTRRRPPTWWSSWSHERIPRKFGVAARRHPGAQPDAPRRGRRGRAERAAAGSAATRRRRPGRNGRSAAAPSASATG